jgi:hypothetical protein
MDMRRLVGRNFARLRLAKGFTQERFAEVSGVTQQYVSGLRHGNRERGPIDVIDGNEHQHQKKDLPSDASNHLGRSRIQDRR